MIKHLVYFTFGLIATLTTVNAESVAPQKTLNILNQQINAIQKTMSNDQNHLLQLENELKQSEILLGSMHQELDATNEQLQQQSKNLQLLKNQKMLFQQSLQQQQALLAKQVRNNYILGQEDYLKMILNQENPSIMGRNLIYYRYFNQARSKLIKNFSQMVSQLKQNQTHINQQTSQLKLLAAQKQQKISTLDERSKHRDEVRQSLQQEIINNSQQLSTLTQNKQALMRVIEQLRLQETSHPVTPPPLSFSTQHRQIPWPTQGTLAEKYGTPIGNSHLTSSGVLILAPEGQSVYTVYPGKVVFSGWLKGYGLLLIVDHGNGYMSLYGHNQSLFRRVGEHINAGDLIAKVGNSGGFNESGLYFEIRHNGEPLDPESWCANKLA